MEIQHIECLTRMHRKISKNPFSKCPKWEHVIKKQKFLSENPMKWNKRAKKMIWNVLNVHLGHIITEKTPRKADSMDFSVENSDLKIIFRNILVYVGTVNWKFKVI